ncbi:DUF6197 family protein [Ochrobactrum sp. BTU1]|uniref:DUF6197 family protein n=1 Tax=Ochrobactrum sp. BTU1 TaxID=2840456 RepID=UPI001C057011|nr:hypothetical protein KMS41_05185 [Ochrobactrum sp. BTU1]
MKLPPIECPAAALPVFVVLPPETPVSTILRAARDLISVPDRWTKWGYGFEVKPLTEEQAGETPWVTEPEATCFCALGAVRKVTGRADDYQPAVRLLEAGAFDVAEYNDHPSTTHADVLRMFNRAIRRAEAREALALTH